jgi:hypothetical protein
MRINVRRTLIAKTRKSPRGPLVMPGSRFDASHRYDLSAFLTDHKVVQGRAPTAAFSTGRNPRSQSRAYAPLDR